MLDKAPKLAARSLEDGAGLAKANSHAPTKDAIIREFRGKTDAKIEYTEHADGSFNLSLKDQTPDGAHYKRLDQMFHERHKVDIENGQNRQGKEQKVMLVEPGGGKRYVKEEYRELVERRTGARRKRGERFPGYDSWRRKDGSLWLKAPGDKEWFKYQ